MIVMNRRHLRVSIYILSQTLNSVPFDIRRLIQNLFIFKVSKQTMEQIFDELIEVMRNKKDIYKLIELVYENKHVGAMRQHGPQVGTHDFLFINIEQQKFYKNFDEILIT
jgi:hypothetical protein